MKRRDQLHQRTEYEQEESKHSASLFGTHSSTSLVVEDEGIEKRERNERIDKEGHKERCRYRT
jgi:hypothetical protein